MGRKSNIDPKGISMCTKCRHMVQTRAMIYTATQERMLCPICFAEFEKGRLIGQALVEEKIESGLDPEMQKLRDRLKKQGLM